MLWNPFDPLGSLAHALQTAVAAIVELFQHFIAIPMSLDGTPFAQYLYGNALGVYQYIAIVVVAITFIIALFMKRGRASFAQAVIIAFIAGAVGPLWFYVFDQFQLLSNQLSITANLNPKVDVTDGASLLTLAFPSLQISNVVISLLTFGPLLFFMLNLFYIFVSYTFLAVVVKTLGLICFALLALGDRSRKVFSFLVAVGIVVVVIGKPVAILFISIGQGLSSLESTFGSGFVQGIVLMGSIVSAILIQPVLVFLMYRGVSPIVGKVAAAVTGKVRALSENRNGQSVHALSSANASSLRGRSQAIPYSNKEPSYVRRAVEIGGAMAVAKGAAMLAAKAASNVHPAARVAVTVASVGIKALSKRKSSPPRR